MVNNIALDIFNKFMDVSHEFDVPHDDFIRLACYAASATEDYLESEEFTERLDSALGYSVDLRTAILTAIYQEVVDADGLV